MMELIANALDKSCSKLASIEFVHCGIGDEGLKSFTANLNQESFQHLKHLVLVNNYISESVNSINKIHFTADYKHTN